MKLLPFVPFVLLGVSWTVTGCGSSPSTAKADAKTHYYYVDADATQKGADYEDPSKISKATGATQADLDKLGKLQKAAEAEMKKSPSSETKSNYVKLTVDLADEAMYSDALDRRVKYSTALKLYRAALKVDPNNAHAAEAADTIVSIYKSLNKPVPQ